MYLLAPIRHLCDGQITYSDATNGGETSGVSAIDDATSFSLNSLPGELMDIKTTYEAPLSSFDRAVLVTKAFTNPSCVVRSLFGSKQWQNGFAGFRETPNYSSIASLALLAGKQSRFFVDQKLPTELARKMYLAWLDNSLTKSVADEVFVAYSRDTDTPGEVGLITLRLSDGEVSIGLLAVSETCWRQGMATSLLCRAVLWAFEATQRMDAVLSVVTQGGNSSACKCYEMLGLKAVSTQEIKHIWLPE